MKRLLSFLVISFISVFCFAQMDVDYSTMKNYSVEQLTGAKVRIGTKPVLSYTASDGVKYEVGKTITFGHAAGNGVFTSASCFTALTYPTPISSNYYGQSFPIVSVEIGKNYDVWILINAFGGSKIQVNLEQALSLGEIQSEGYTSDKALEELTKWKQKLDLGLITEEEYNNKKAELSKYIK